MLDNHSQNIGNAINVSIMTVNAKTPNRLKTEVMEPLPDDNALSAIVAGTASATGEAFYPALAQHLALALGVRYVIVAQVCEFQDDQPKRVRTLSFWNTDQLADNFEYDLVNTPCESIFTRSTLVDNQGISCFPRQVQSFFPKGEALAKLGGESFLGVALLEKTSRRPLGHICFIDDKPLVHEEHAKAIMSLLATRTAAELERQQAVSALQRSEALQREKAQQLEQALHQLQQTQAQLVQTEKISSLGQLVAGVAHEVNNPVSFIASNITYLREYTENLTHMLHVYQQHYSNWAPEIEAEAERIELEFLLEDLPQIIDSMQVGAERIQEVMSSLRTFSRVDEAYKKPADLHSGIDSTLLILQHRLKATQSRPAILLVKDYGDLPLVHCYPGQLNQVFMNLLSNAIDAVEESNRERTFAEIEHQPNQIEIQTSVVRGQSSQATDYVVIRIADNGPGMTEEVRQQVFRAFFTTKPSGKGTGLGLSISHQIITKNHEGRLYCLSTPGVGTEFVIEIPIDAALSS